MISQIGASDAFLADDFREGTCKRRDGSCKLRTGHELDKKKGLSDKKKGLSDNYVTKKKA
jgi:hypothetical protein